MNWIPSLALLLICLSATIQAVGLFRAKGGRDPASHWALGAAGASLLAYLAGRSLAIGFPALTGTFESLVFYSAVVCLLCLAWRLQKAIPFSAAVQFGATVAALALLSVANSPLAPKEAAAPIQALRSGWLVAHVALSFVGESFFVSSFIASILFLASKDEKKRKAYDRICYTSVTVGYPIFTTGALIFGAVWAQRAWGSWWSWDPKETWALVTWLAYSVYLHIRLLRGRRGALPAWVAVIGFICATFTFFGVNFLLPGLHSYA